MTYTNMNIEMDEDIQYYWQELGLQHEPFADSYSQIFRVGQWENYYELLAHLSQHSQVLKLVIGEQGIGKSSFITQFAKSTKGYFDMSLLQASPSWSVEQFVRGVNSNMGFAQNEATSQSLEMINAHLPQGDLSHVVTIDNAEQLNDEILMLLKDWTNKPQDITSLKFVLVADISLQHRLKLLMTTYEAEKLLHIFELKPLDIEQTQAYLEHCLVAAGFEGSFLFSQREVTKIYRQSKGIFANINLSARRILIDKLVKGGKFNGFIQEYRKQLMMGAIIMIVAAVFMFSRQSVYEENQHIELGLPSEVDSSIQKKQDDEIFLSDLSSLDDIEKSASDSLFGRAKESSKEPIVPIEVKNQKVQEDTVTDDIITQSLLDEIVIAKQSLEGAKNDTSIKLPSSSPQKIASTKILSNKLQEREKIIMMEFSSNYTIQLMAGNTESSAIGFIRNNKLETNANYYMNKQPTRTWYSVIYGSFESRDDARFAVTKLPFSIRKNNPWIRKYSEVQNIITSNSLNHNE